MSEEKQWEEVWLVEKEVCEFPLKWFHVQILTVIDTPPPLPFCISVHQAYKHTERRKAPFPDVFANYFALLFTMEKYIHKVEKHHIQSIYTPHTVYMWSVHIHQRLGSYFAMIAYVVLFTDCIIFTYWQYVYMYACAQNSRERRTAKSVTHWLYPMLSWDDQICQIYTTTTHFAQVVNLKLKIGPSLSLHTIEEYYAWYTCRRN